MTLRYISTLNGLSCKYNMHYILNLTWLRSYQACKDVIANLHKASPIINLFAGSSVQSASNTSYPIVNVTSQDGAISVSFNQSQLLNTTLFNQSNLTSISMNFYVINSTVVALSNYNRTLSFDLLNSLNISYMVSSLNITGNSALNGSSITLTVAFKNGSLHVTSNNVTQNLTVAANVTQYVSAAPDELIIGSILYDMPEWQKKTFLSGSVSQPTILSLIFPSLLRTLTTTLCGLSTNLLAH